MHLVEVWWLFPMTLGEIFLSFLRSKTGWGRESL